MKMTMKILLIACSLWTVVDAYPFRISINYRANECMWEKLKKGEAATMSVYILEGNKLQGQLLLEGPFAKYHLEDTMEIVEAEHNFAMGTNRWTEHDMFQEIVDFEHMSVPPIEDVEIPMIEYDDDDDDDAVAAEKDQIDNQEDADATAEKLKEKRAKRAAQRRVQQQARRKRAQLLQERTKEQSRKVRSEGSPHQKTLIAKDDGWFRGCLHANTNRVLAELEFRSSTALGGVDPETGHVYSYDKWEWMQDEKLLDEATPEDEPAVKPEDFQNTRNKMRELHRKVNEISSLQQRAKNRVSVHSTLNEHAHSTMTQNSFLMTVLFVGVTAVQVFIITKWFSGGNASLLAR